MRGTGATRRPVLQLPLACAATGPGPDQRPGDPGRLDDLQQPRAPARLVLGEPRREISRGAGIVAGVLIGLGEME
jgi:hypothetical protein